MQRRKSVYNTRVCIFWWLFALQSYRKPVLPRDATRRDAVAVLIIPEFRERVESTYHRTNRGNTCALFLGNTCRATRSGRAYQRDDNWHRHLDRPWKSTQRQIFIRQKERRAKGRNVGYHTNVMLLSVILKHNTQLKSIGNRNRE